MFILGGLVTAKNQKLPQIGERDQILEPMAVSGTPGLYRDYSRKVTSGCYTECTCVLLPKEVWNISLTGMFWLIKCSERAAQVRQYNECTMRFPRQEDRRGTVYLEGGKPEEVRNVSCELTPTFSILGFALLSANLLSYSALNAKTLISS